ncbi:uncharacterized protein LOC127244830 [Andrographis paniculata]|uniref:uncharacterized protein LOC127244830 n=1 Tax=Andrographis paniculata TaxID=175694 RepID=UPI0021E6E301|nr:uncharacterized protein LOC127244830 [Andrographis paniculata]
MDSSSRPLIALFLIVGSILTSAEDNALFGRYKSSPTAEFYDILTSNGLPIGIFPKGISEFSIDPVSGRFFLRLMPPSPCDAKFETRVRYQREISGELNYGRIANLTGVAAEELFLWLPVKGIRVDIPSSGLIYFDVELVSKQFSLSFFETPKDCNALEAGDVAGGNDVFLLRNDRLRSAEQNRHGKLSRKGYTSEEQRAVS